MTKILFTLPILFMFNFGVAQEGIQPTTIQELKQEILALQNDVNNVQVNLGLSQKRFQRGILVATLGYSITIAGGLMLGRNNDELGQTLLVVGGATGITGTYLLVDSFKFLGRASKKIQ